METPEEALAIVGAVLERQWQEHAAFARHTRRLEGQQISTAMYAGSASAVVTVALELCCKIPGFDQYVPYMKSRGVLG